MFDLLEEQMTLNDFVAAMERVRDAALRAPASHVRDEAVYGIEQAAAWAVTVAQRGSAVAPVAVIERARSAARVCGGASMARVQHDGGNVDAALRDAFAVVGWRW
jgi:hypothetical protein